MTVAVRVQAIDRMPFDWTDAGIQGRAATPVYTQVHRPGRGNGLEQQSRARRQLRQQQSQQQQRS
jgi:hypothetical protein